MGMLGHWALTGTDMVHLLWELECRQLTDDSPFVRSLNGVAHELIAKRLAYHQTPQRPRRASPDPDSMAQG